MDQLKKSLAIAVKYSFWIMCVGILLVSVAGWYLATSDLTAQQTKNLGEIQAKYTSVESVKKINPHPNDSTKKGMEQLSTMQSEDILRGWNMLTENQQAVLVWPTRFDQKFQDAVKEMRQIETKIGYSEKGESLKDGLSDDNRRLYYEFIELELPSLAKKIGAIWKVKRETRSTPSSGMTSMPSAGSSIAGGMGLGYGATVRNPDDKALVLWKQASQEQLVNYHFGFTKRSDPPSTLEILYAQEDLWVLENLMAIIAATNKGAEGRHEATVKIIDSLAIGKSAGGLNGKITPAGSFGGGGGGTGAMAEGSATMPGMSGGMPGMSGGMPGMSGGMPGMSSGAGSGMPGMSSGAATGGPAAGPKVAPHPADFRYVDRDYEPLLGGRLRDALNVQSSKKDDLLLAVAKRMPVRMKLTIDQRKLHLLLAECSNSKLPLEVRQVRIGKTDASSTGGGGMPGMGSSGMSSSSMMSSSGSSDYGSDNSGFQSSALGGTSDASSARRPLGDTASTDKDPNEVNIEIFGIVYIYMPVNKKLLKIIEPPKGTASTPGPGTVVTPTVAPAPAVPTKTPAGTKTTSVPAGASGTPLTPVATVAGAQ